MDALQLQIPALRSLAVGKAMAAIFTLSLAILAFLIWLLYFKPAVGAPSALISSLPALNATFNATSAVFLVLAYLAIRRRQINRHVTFIFGALVSSTLFFISYVIYHYYHGDTKFLATGPIRPTYFFILISHILLSAIVVPMILTSLYLALSGKFATHKRVARLTFPIWLYVSITGVLIFLLLKAFNP